MIRTRFAPSPTGFLHIGGLRTAVYAYALAKHDKGEFLLRIEDTDQKREVPQAREKLYEILQRFNLNWDQEPIIQSQRVATEVYKLAAQKLLKDGHAYEDEGAIRLKVPKNETISFRDFVLNKDISWSSDDVPEAVLLKSDGFPTYHLASVVDDHESKITHVIRSVEWLSSTPIHVLVYKYLGYEMPQIGHPTAILDPEGGKLSKRKGNVAVEEFLKDGYLPEAILNFVILLGWAPKDNRELFTLEEFVHEFDIKGFQKSNPIMNLSKLDWFNGHYIRQKSDKELVQLIKSYSQYATDKNFPQLVTLVKDRLIKLSDFDNLVRFIFETPNPDTSLVKKEHLQLALEIFSSSNINQDLVDNTLIPEVKNRQWKIGDFFMSLRVAICGSKFTPPLTEVMIILGKTEVLKRLNHLLAIL